MSGWRPDPSRWVQVFGGLQEPLVFGHRGFGKGRSPGENTGPSFDAALAAGADGLEADVILSQDGVPVIAHGPTAEAAGFPNIRIDQLTYAELAALDFGRTVGGPRAPLLTLAEFLERYSGRTILNIELKLWNVFDSQLERLFVPLVAPYLARGDRVYCSSFNPFALRRVQRLLPQMCIGMLWRDDLNWFARNRSLFAFVRPDFLQPFEGRVDSELLKYAEEHRYRVHTWTVNEEARFRALVGSGIPVIFSDEVAAAVSWRDALRMSAGAPNTAQSYLIDS